MDFNWCVLPKLPCLWRYSGGVCGLFEGQNVGTICPFFLVHVQRLFENYMTIFYHFFSILSTNIRVF